MAQVPRSLKSKIKTPKALKRLLAHIRGPIVFTNGCFDLLHRGHVNYLERARKLGQTLIVALNSDASVQKLKGPSRPLNPLADRLEVMASLEAVDYVTWFEEETPLELIQFLKPTVLVKGGDWKATQIVGSNDVQARGGKVRSLSYLAGCSTTALIAKAQLSPKGLSGSRQTAEVLAPQKTIKKRHRR